MVPIRLGVHAFDRNMIHITQSLPSSVGLIMAGASVIGQPLASVAVGLATVLVALQYANNSVVKAAIASLMMLGLSPLIKIILRRARPETAAALGLHNYSFPSGHAYSTLLIYGLLLIIALKFLPAPWSWVVAIGLAVFIVLVGVSRVYLGAHYPTDVIGGWVLGLVVLGIIVRWSGLL